MVLMSQCGKVKKVCEEASLAACGWLGSYTPSHILVCTPERESFVAFRVEKVDKEHRATVGVLCPWRVFQSHHNAPPGRPGSSNFYRNSQRNGDNSELPNCHSFHKKATHSCLSGDASLTMSL